MDRRQLNAQQNAFKDWCPKYFLLTNLNKATVKLLRKDKMRKTDLPLGFGIKSYLRFMLLIECPVSSGVWKESNPIQSPSK